MFLEPIVTLIIIMMLSFSIFKLLDINPSVTPFIAIATLGSVVSIFALVKMLKLGVIVGFLLIAIIFIYTINKHRQTVKRDMLEFFTPGIILFLISGGFIFIVLATQRPTISQWDEFSFWGISQKLTKAHGQIYTFYESSMVGNTTPPSLAVLSYIFQPIGTVFVEWKAFFAYDILLLSSFCAWTAAFKKDKWGRGFMVYLLGIITPFIFEVYTRIVYLSPVYISLMSDIPLGVVFAGALAVYLFAKRDRQDTFILLITPILFFFTLMKDMGFAFSLIVIFIICIDMLISNEAFVFLKLKGVMGKLFAAGTLVMSTIISFFAWTYHMRFATNTNRFELGGERGMGMAEMVITGILEFFSKEKSVKFIDMQQELLSALFTRPISMFGNGINILIIIAVLFMLAFLWSGDKKDKKRIAGLYITAAIGFIAYYIFQIFLYCYIFKANAYGLPSYERYIYPYYIAWLALGVFSLIIAAKNKKHDIAASAVLYCVVLVVFLRFSYLVSYENTFLKYNDSHNSTVENVKDTLDAFEGAIHIEDKIYCYSDREDSGQRWFVYTYLLAPNVVIQDIPWFDPSGMTPKEINLKWREYLIEHIYNTKATHFLLDYGSQELNDAFGDALGIDTKTIGRLNAGYYKIEYISPTEIGFNLVKMAEVK